MYYLKPEEAVNEIGDLTQVLTVTNICLILLQSCLQCIN